MTSRHCVLFKGGGLPLDGLKPAGLRILAALDLAARTFTHDIVVTSVMRSDAGGHGRGEAVDVRLKDWPAWQVMAVYQFLKQNLGPDFTVLYEVPRSTLLPDLLKPIAYPSDSATAVHFHIQLRKGFGPWPPHAATTDLAV